MHRYKFNWRILHTYLQIFAILCFAQYFHADSRFTPNLFPSFFNSMFFLKIIFLVTFFTNMNEWTRKRSSSFYVFLVLRADENLKEPKHTQLNQHRDIG